MSTPPVRFRFPGTRTGRVPASLVALVAALALTAATSPPTRTIEARIKAAEQRTHVGDLRGARDEWLGVIEHDADHPRALIGLSQVEAELAEDAVGERARELASDAVTHGRAAIAAVPDSARAHLALAVALGRQSQHEGSRTRLALAREIKSEVDRAIELNPTLGRAYHVRAVWNRDIATLGVMGRTAARSMMGGVPKGASMEHAVRDFQRAIELEPNVVRHHLELARTYVKLKKKPEAIAEFERVIELPVTSSPRDVVYRGEAREMLYHLQKR